MPVSGMARTGPEDWAHLSASGMASAGRQWPATRRALLSALRRRIDGNTPDLGMYREKIGPIQSE